MHHAAVNRFCSFAALLAVHLPLQLLLYRLLLLLLLLLLHRFAASALVCSGLLLQQTDMANWRRD